MTVCALYCNNCCVGEQKGATLDPGPTHIVEEEGVFLAPCHCEQTENGSIFLPPLGFTKQFKDKQNLVVSFDLFFKSSAAPLLVLIRLCSIFLFYVAMSQCALRRNLQACYLPR